MFIWTQWQGLTSCGRITSSIVGMDCHSYPHPLIPVIHVYTDTSGSFGCGGIPRVFALLSAPMADHVDIFVKELVPIVIGKTDYGTGTMCAFTLIIWLWSWSFIKSQHDIPYWRTMYYALFYCALFQFHHVVEHVPEVLNVAVDALSRNNLHLFSSLLPQATAPRSRPHYLISCWFAGQTRDRTATNCYLPCNHLLILPFPFPKCSPVVFGTPSWHWFLTCIHRFVSVWLTVCSDSGWVARSSVVDLPPAELCVMHQVRYTVCSLPSPYYPPVLLDTWCQPGPLSLHDHTMLWAASYLGFFFWVPEIGRVYLSLLGRMPHAFCPVAAILAYMVKRGSSHGPLFLFEDGSPLTKHKLVAIRIPAESLASSSARLISPPCVSWCILLIVYALCHWLHVGTRI